MNQIVWMLCLGILQGSSCAPQFGFASKSVSFTCPTDTNGFFAIPGECSGRYINCVNGNLYEMVCPEDTVFDQDNLACEPWYMVPYCALTTSTTSTQKTTIVSPTGSPYTCPDKNGFYSIPGECSGRYFACVNGNPFEEFCPGDTIFDATYTACEPWDQVPCALTTTTTVQSTITPFPYSCPADNGFYGIPGECSARYINCVNGHAYEDFCPEETIFDQDKLACMPWDQVPCAITTRTTTTTQTSTTIISTTSFPFTCPIENGFYAIPGECSGHYINCVSGTAYEKFCPDGTIFDEADVACEPWDQVPCAFTTSTTTTESTSSTTTSTPLACPDKNGFYGIPGECSARYINCVNGNPYEEFCPENTLFDQDDKACQPWNQVPCAITTSTASITTEYPYSCPAQNGFYAIPEECSNRYVNCVHGHAYLAECPENTLFNGKTGSCEDPENVPCYNTRSTNYIRRVKFASNQIIQLNNKAETQPTTDSSGVKTAVTPIWWFSCPGSGKFPNPQDCSSWIICVNGQAWLQSCGPGTLYDGLSQTCKLADNVQCQAVTNYQRTSPTLSAVVTVNPTYKCTSEDGMLPNPASCGSFYWCVNSVPYIMACPASTEFSAELQQCVDPDVSGCIVSVKK